MNDGPLGVRTVAMVLFSTRAEQPRRPEQRSGPALLNGSILYLLRPIGLGGHLRRPHMTDLYLMKEATEELLSQAHLPGGRDR